MLLEARNLSLSRGPLSPELRKLLLKSDSKLKAFIRLPGKVS
jgi:hypothetical protein